MTDAGGSGAGSIDQNYEQWVQNLVVGHREALKQVAQLRADLEAARSEVETLRVFCDSDEFNVFERLRKKDQADLAQARARIEVLECVAKAASQLNPALYRGVSMIVLKDALAALKALDAAQAAQQPQHASDTTAALGDLQSPGPFQAAPEH